MIAREPLGALSPARGFASGLAASVLAFAAACTPLAAPPGGSATGAGLAAPPAASAAAALPADRIQILHTDDIHGRLEAAVVGVGTTRFEQGGMATLAAQVTSLRKRAPQRTLLVDSGDAWQGTFISNANKGQAVTQAMNLMRYDALAVGNHEFDWGQDTLAQRAHEAAFPFLGANVIDATGNLPTYLRPYTVKDLGIAKVARTAMVQYCIATASWLTLARFNAALAPLRSGASARTMSAETTDPMIGFLLGRTTDILTAGWRLMTASISSG